jgi:hypothetical protein
VAQPNRIDPRVQDGFRPIPSTRPIETPTLETQRRNDDEIVLDTTEARQASPRRMNLRVLFWSMLAAAIIGFVMVSMFWKATPPAMDAQNPAAATSVQSPANQAVPAIPAPAAPPAPNTAQ